VSPRTRIAVLVAVVALAAAAVAVAAAVLGGDEQGGGGRKGNPPLVLDLGLRSDREAQDLRHAAGLYAEGRLETSSRAALTTSGQRDTS